MDHAAHGGMQWKDAGYKGHWPLVGGLGEGKALPDSIATLFSPGSGY